MQDVGLGEGGSLGCGQTVVPKESVLECEGVMGQPPSFPTSEVEPHTCGIDASEELLLLRGTGRALQKGIGADHRVCGEGHRVIPHCP